MSEPAFAELRASLVRQLRDRGALRDERVAAAFLRVPRHVFVPNVAPEDVYSDRSIAIKLQDGVPVSSSSQPAIMAEMLEMLHLRGGERVLEIGAGTGYNAALLTELVGPSGAVVTIDVDPELVAAARRQLDEAGYPQVRTVCADGVHGDPGGAPYDRIISTVGVDAIPAAWIAQLRGGGRLVAPLTIRCQQKVVAFERTARGLESDAMVDAGFIMLRGCAPPADSVALALGEPTTTLRVLASHAHAVDVRALARALQGASRDTPPARRMTVDAVWDGFALWLALNDDAFCRLTAQGATASAGHVPSLAAGSGSCYGFAATLGIAGADELVVFAPQGHHEVVLRHFGADRGGVARLQRTIVGWYDAGRPNNGGLHVTIDPAGTAHVTFGEPREPS